MKSGLQGLFDWFESPHFQGERDKAWSRFLVVLAFSGVPFWVGFAAWYWFDLNSGIGAILTLTVGTLGALTPFLLRRTGSICITSFALAADVFLGIGGIALIRGGFPISVLVWSIVIPVCAAMQKELRVLAPVWTVLCLLEFTIFYLLAITGNAPDGIVGLSETQAYTESYLVLVGLLLLLLLVSWAAAEVTDRLATERDEYERLLVQSQRLEGVGRLAGGIAHDFNNLLMVVQCSADILSHKLPSDHPGRDELGDIRSSMEKAQSLTRQLLLIGRKDSSEPRLISINQSVIDLERMLRHLLGNRIELQKVMERHLPMVRIDPKQLDQVILNLVVNAHDAMAEGGLLILRTSSVDERVLLEVLDSGHGVAPDVLEQIFEPFYTTKREGSGTGLGMWICRSIVSAAGGEISVDSTPGKGTTVRISLPRADPVESLASGVSQAISPGTRHATRIMVVDDEEALRQLVESALLRDGYTVIGVGNSREAIESFGHSEGIDLLLTDVMMPGMSGRELARELQEQRPDLKVVFMTGQMGTVVERYGPVDSAVLEKPFTTEQLLQRVQLELSTLERKY